jgi:HD-GYP domain-containing protein (c-di-GMP phosphodiesterase class II)
MLPNGAQFANNGHDRRVALLAAGLGRALGMPVEEQEILARAGLLHDVGKLGIPREILLKNGPLTEEEWRIMRTHPELGTQMAASMFGSTDRFAREMLAVLHHHERMDGGGYPHGLASAEIPIEARIVAVADTFDALTSDRPYRKACSAREARRVLREEAGSRLDARAVTALCDALDLQDLRAPRTKVRAFAS